MQDFCSEHEPKVLFEIFVNFGFCHQYSNVPVVPLRSSPLDFVLIYLKIVNSCAQDLKVFQGLSSSKICGNTEDFYKNIEQVVLQEEEAIGSFLKKYLVTCTHTSPRKQKHISFLWQIEENYKGRLIQMYWLVCLICELIVDISGCDKILTLVLVPEPGKRNSPLYLNNIVLRAEF